MSFSNTAIQALEKKNIKKYFKVIIDNDVIPRGRVQSYGYSSNKNFASEQLSIVLDNRDAKYSNKSWYNSVIEFYEGVVAGGQTETVRKFYGYIRQIEFGHSGTVNTVTLTAFDILIRLSELEIEQKFEASKTKVTLETLTPNFIAFYATINGIPTTTSVPYDGVLSESTLQAGDTLYNVTDSYSERTVVSIDTDNSIITTTASSDSWANNDEIVKSTRVQVLDLANTNIADFPEPIIKVKNRDDELEDPLWEGFQILYEQGQILLGKPLNWAEYLVRCTYYYYPSATALYAEDIIEDILIAEDGYGETPYTVADNLTETFSNMTGNTIDNMTANSEAEVIDGTAYDIGQVWYTKFSNISTTLTASDFSVSGGASIDTVDLRYGRIILDQAIATNATVQCLTDYSFKTISATGIQLTKIEFTNEDTTSRLEAINRIRDLLAPNFSFQTLGSQKIWGRYLYQKDTADYTAKNILNLNKAEDLEVYTRVRLFGQNSNPQNILYSPDVSVVQDTSEYYSEVSNQEITFKEEKDSWRLYDIGLGEGARIISSYEGQSSWPVVYVNNIPIDDDSYELLMQQVEWKRREEYKQECHSWCTKYKMRSFRKYWIYFSHSEIDPDQPITFYNSTGAALKTLSANDTDMNYGEGYYFRDVGEGDAAWIQNVSTASYYIRYSTGKLEILWNQGKFKIHTSMFSANRADLVTATFTYSAIYTAPGGIERLIDGRYTTQVQTEFNTKPSAGFTWAIIDLGSAQEADAIDLIGGFFYPDNDQPSRRFNTTGWFTLQYSPDDVDDADDAIFYNLTQEGINFKLEGGESKSFERKELGDSFQLRYLKIIIEDLEQISYEDGIYVAAFSELAIYKDIVLSESAYLTSDINLEDDSHLYDTDGLLSSIGDKLYKVTTINGELSNTTKIQRRAKALLREFTKNNTTMSGTLIYAPHYQVGQTLRVIDNKNSIDSNYFIESIANNNGIVSLELARYPRYKVLGGQDPGVARQ